MFKVDAALFESMRLGDGAKKPAVKRRNQLLEDREIATQVLQATLRKFCNLCTFFNVDPLNPHALALVLLMSCKSKNRMNLALSYVQHRKIDVQLEDGESAVDAVQTVADWCKILQYLKLAEVTSIENDSFRKKIQKIMLQAGLTVGENRRSLIDKMLLYCCIRNTPTSRMIEQFLRDNMPSERDVATKAMQLANLFWDTVYDEEEFDTTLCEMMIASTPSEKLGVDVAKIVQDQNFMSSTIVEKADADGRPRLRELAKTLHAGVHVPTRQSFKSWSAQCGFPTTTSTQVQRLLYFVRVQQVEVPNSCFSHLFTEDVLKRSLGFQIQQIDVAALQTIIQSMRVYKNNIADLIDFRSQCLLGLSLETRNKLSLAQVLQLYTCIFQHNSVWEECWKSIVPVMNHTIASARVRFCEKHAFDAAGVVATMIACHVGAKTADALAGEGAEA